MRTERRYFCGGIPVLRLEFSAKMLLGKANKIRRLTHGDPMSEISLDKKLRPFGIRKFLGAFHSAGKRQNRKKSAFCLVFISVLRRLFKGAIQNLPHPRVIRPVQQNMVFFGKSEQRKQIRNALAAEGKPKMLISRADRKIVQLVFGNQKGLSLRRVKLRKTTDPRKNDMQKICIAHARRYNPFVVHDRMAVFGKKKILVLPTKIADHRPPPFFCIVPFFRVFVKAKCVIIVYTEISLYAKL